MEETLSASLDNPSKKLHLASSSRDGKLWRQLVGMGLSHKSIRDPGGGGPRESRLLVELRDGPDVSAVESVLELDHAEAKLESSEPLKKSVEPLLEESSFHGAKSELIELTVWTL
jgi:hypothetical protein